MSKDKHKLGEYIWFKDDYEKSGKIVEIHINGMLTVEWIEPRFGEREYIDVDPDDAWK